MVGPKLTVSSSGDLNFIRSAVGDLANAETYIGVPEDTTARKRNSIGPQQSSYVTNAGLMYIHTNGSQLKNIPARPVIEPALQANRLFIESQLHLIANDMLDGKKKEATQRLRMLGTFGANAAKSWFTDPRNGWPQNAPSTIRKKLGKLKRKGIKANKRYLNAMTVLSLVPQYMPRYGTSALDNINTPLIDIGELRRSITHVEKI